MLKLVVVLLFVLMMTMVATWFVALAWLFRRLRDKHAGVYNSIGEPTLFWNNSPKNNWLFTKFLFGRDSRTIADESIVRLCWFLRGFFISYFAVFIALLVLVTCTDALDGLVTLSSNKNGG